MRMLLLNSVERFLYKNILKKFFFMLDPEFVHDRMTSAGRFLGSFSVGRFVTRKLFHYSDPILEQEIAGIKFGNPIGLAAGFDKNAKLTQILPDVGFGFEEIGSITGEPCPGNSGQRLWRLKESEGLVVYYGLMNDGCEAISERLKNKKLRFPLGVSVAKTNSPDTVEEEKGIADYLKAYKAFKDKNIGDYFTINISCPNAFGGEPFTDPAKLDRLLSTLSELDPNPSKPIFIKMPSEIKDSDLDQIISLGRKYRITGFICTNLAKSRNNPNLKEKSVPGVGGMSGKVVRDLSDELVKKMYQKTKGEFVIMGCGGIFSAKDAYRKIRNGASLLQMITGMIFEGPQVIGEINRGLAYLLRRDGFKNISEAVGVDA